MKKYFVIAALMGTMPLAAQETYENAKLMGEDLNGTARYVGMGGAMEALGADLSTISSNPAGLGLFRHSTASFSAGAVIQSGAESFAKGDKTNISFDQLGFVYAVQTGENSFLNFGVNYHKSKNFNFILAAANGLDGNSSQNKLTYEKLRNGFFTNVHDANYSQLDDIYVGNLLYDETDDAYYAYGATDYMLNREHEGYIADYDFNISGNIQDRIFLGLTFGVKDVNYKHHGTYAETLQFGPLTTIDDREIEGTGFDIKAGVIVRPIEESPFRVGFYVHTPTWYDLTTSNNTVMTDGTVNVRCGESYDFKVFTPWKFGLSLGHTVGKILALGATYEYADYGSTKTRVNDRGYYDAFDHYDDSSNDRFMNDHTSATLKGVSTLKLGAEYKPIPELALRLGYNYVSPKYEKSGEKGYCVYPTGVSEIGTYYSSATDYTNWKGTNRVTFGVGYQIDKFNIDLAYQYSAQKGDFYPFTTTTFGPEEGEAATANYNIATKSSVKNNRNQLLLTVGYHF